MSVVSTISKHDTVKGLKEHTLQRKHRQIQRYSLSLAFNTDNWWNLLTQRPHYRSHDNFGQVRTHLKLEQSIMSVTITMQNSLQRNNMYCFVRKTQSKLNKAYLPKRQS